jgi:hypothetical protein
MFNGSTTASPILFGIYDTTNVQEAARISAARNFIVGKVVDSGQKLQISGNVLIDGTTSGSYITTINQTNTNTDNSFGLLIRGGTSVNDYALRIQNAAATANLLSVTGSGNVGINTITPTARLYAIGNSTTEEIFYAEKSTASFTGNVITSLTYTASGTGWNHFVGYSDIGGVTNIKILGNGNIQNANNSYGAISDIKLKENIVDTSDKLNDLLKVKIRNFNLIGQQMKQIGVIAQELENIFPNLIEETNDIDKNGVNLGTTTKSVKYSVFIPILIKAMQELNAKIENLK